jgi:hypothetical protein
VSLGPAYNQLIANERRPRIRAEDCARSTEGDTDSRHTYSETIEMEATLARAARLIGSHGTRRRQDIVRCAAMLIKCDDE